MPKSSWLKSIVIAYAISVPALAEDKLPFDIPAQEASTAIQEWARQSGLQVFAADEHLRGVRTNAVRGAYLPLEAVRLLIQGTGLEAISTGDKTVTIRKPHTAEAIQTTGEPPMIGLTVSEVVVTGSRIGRAGYDTLEAAVVTDSQQIRQRGYTNVAEALNATPVFSPSGANPIGASQSDFGAGQSFVDLFGLGSQRTLTLVNGRRFVSSNTASGSGNSSPPGQQVDLNVIPIGLVERVETIAIGGAPVYGADAISGTVNIILKDDFEGVDLDAQYGDTQKTDASSYSARALMGLNFAGDRGNAVLAAEFNKQNGIVMGRRSGLYVSLPNSNPPPLNFVNPDFVYSNMTEGGLPFNPGTLGYITSDGTPTGTALQFANDGSLVPFSPGTDADGLDFDVISIGGDGVRMANHFSLLSPTERVLVNSLAHFDVTPSTRVFFEASYASSEGAELSEVAAFAAPFISGTFVPFDINNAFLTDQARSTLLANGVTETFIVARNFSDVLEQGELNSTTVDLYRAVVGMEGDIRAFGDSMSWDVSYNYGRSRGLTKTRFINEARLLNAIDAVRDPSGNIVCASGGDCVPINLFGQNAFSQEAADYVLDQGEAISQNTQRVLTANVGGRLPFGIGGAEPLSVNIGTEFRKEDASFEPDALLQTGTSLFGLDLASPYIPTSGGFSTNEYYLETLTPLLSSGQQITGIKSLALQGAVRYVDNSIAGGDTTWSAGTLFTPRLPGWGDGLTLRAVYTRSIRAPAITELFSGAVPTRGSVDDPCDATRYNQGNNPEVRARNCAAALAELGYASPADFNSTTTGLSPIGTTSGNPDLENEAAKSWSAGFVYQPTLLPNFRAAVDWSHIELKDGIQEVGIDTLLAACYDNPNFPNAAGCDAFRRLAPSEVGSSSPNPARVAGDVANGYRSGYRNLSSIEFAGMIVSAEYDTNLQDLVSSWENAGSIKLSSKVFYRDQYDVVTGVGQPVDENVGLVGVPKYAGQFNVAYAVRKLELMLQGLWTSSVKNDVTADEANLPARYNNIDDYWRFGSTIAYNVSDKARLQFIVNNLFDNRPSESQILSLNFGTYDLIGRSYLVTARTSF